MVRWAPLDADILALIDQSACLVEPCVLDGPLGTLPCLFKPHQARPTPRPVAARECPSRGLAERLVLLRAAPSRPLSSSLTVTRAPCPLATCLCSDRDRLAHRCRVIMSRLWVTGQLMLGQLLCHTASMILALRRRPLASASHPVSTARHSVSSAPVFVSPRGIFPPVPAIELVVFPVKTWPDVLWVSNGTHQCIIMARTP